MDDLKRRIFRLVEEERIREDPHFRQRCAERDATLMDAVKGLKNGKLRLDKCEGDNLCFQGIDTKERSTFVVIKIDDSIDLMHIVTIWRD